MDLDFVFYPRSIAIVGITTLNVKHWTRAFLTGLVEFKYPGKLYLVNPKGGQIEGITVCKSLEEIGETIDYVIGLIPASAAPELVTQVAYKGTRVIHFCTAGFSETGEKEGIRLEKEVLEAAKKHNIRIIGPNCLGVYCPDSRVSFSPLFPKESGNIGFLSQSGGNFGSLMRDAGLRGVRFSKAVSYGNAGDLNEADFLEYFANDPKTEIVAMYIEGLKDGKRFRQALEKISSTKPVIIFKGGVTEGGARAVAGHTSSLAGNERIWDSLCKQFNIIRVNSLTEIVDVLVTLGHFTRPKGRNAVIIGGGGGASVMITDKFEKKGLKVPQLPQDIISKIREYTPVAGNILKNPVDYSDGLGFRDKVEKTLTLINEWEGADFIVKFIRAGQTPTLGKKMGLEYLLEPSKTGNGITSKPVAAVIEGSLLPPEQEGTYETMKFYADRGLPVYHSFDSAATAIDRVLSYYETKDRRG